MINNAHALKPEEALAAANSLPTGLSPQEAALRIKQYGKNTLQEKKVNKLILLFRQFNNLLVYILIAASAISLWLGDFKDFVVIMGLVFFNGILGFWQELKAEASIEAL